MPEVVHDTERDLAAERDAIVAKTTEWLAKSGALVGKLMREFPVGIFTTYPSQRLYHGRHVPYRVITTPRIVLPVAPLRSLQGEAVERRSATNLLLFYRSPDESLIDAIRATDLPAPQTVQIGWTHPVALPFEGDRDDSQKYTGTENTGLNDEPIDMYRWTTHDGGLVFPRDPDPTNRMPDVYDYDVFSEFPSEGLARHRRAVAFHDRLTQLFGSQIELIENSVGDPALNPR